MIDPEQCQPSSVKRVAVGCALVTIFAAIAIIALLIAESAGTSRRHLDFFSAMIVYSGPGAFFIGWMRTKQILRLIGR